MYLNEMTKVRDYIAAQPAKRIVMRNWIKHNRSTIVEFDHFASAGCGTAACNAGHAAVALNLLKQCVSPDHDGLISGAAFEYDPVQHKLGLSFLEAESLFGMHPHWPNFDSGTFAFDKLDARKRKRLVLQLWDRILTRGFDWIDKFDRSTVTESPRHKKIIEFPTNLS